MLVRCSNKRCQAEISKEWSFCSFCGADNREPSLRVSITDCDHQIERGEFCVKCGASTIDLNENPDPSAIWQEVAGWSLLIGGAVMVAVGQMFLRIRQSNSSEVLRPVNDQAAQDRALELAAICGRLGFLFIPAGVILVVFFGKRWKVFGNR